MLNRDITSGGAFSWASLADLREWKEAHHQFGGAFVKWNESPHLEHFSGTKIKANETRPSTGICAVRMTALVPQFGHFTCQIL